MTMPPPTLPVVTYTSGPNPSQSTYVTTITSNQRTFVETRTAGPDPEHSTKSCSKLFGCDCDCGPFGCDGGNGIFGLGGGCGLHGCGYHCGSTIVPYGTQAIGPAVVPSPTPPPPTPSPPVTQSDQSQSDHSTTTSSSSPSSISCPAPESYQPFFTDSAQLIATDGYVYVTGTYDGDDSTTHAPTSTNPYPYTETDVKSNIVACQTSAITYYAGYQVTLCEGDQSTIYTAPQPTSTTSAPLPEQTILWGWFRQDEHTVPCVYVLALKNFVLCLMLTVIIGLLDAHTP